MRIRRAVALALASGLPLLASSSAVADARGPFLKGPYLHALGADRIEVRLELERAAPVVLDIAAEGEPKDTKRREGASAGYHSLAITGLSPQRRYQYTVRVVGADAGAGVARGSFTTAPKDDATPPFSFLVYGDNRSDHAAHAALVRTMKSEPGDFLLHTGDFVEDGNSAEDWQRFFDIESDLLRDRCLFASVGNHELADRVGANFLRYVGPGAQLGEDKPQLFGSMRWQNTRFFFLNFMTDDRAAEKAWLEEELTRADKEPGVAWRIVVAHHGPWSSGPHGKNKRMHESGIPDLMKKHGVDLVISGHDHIYERGRADGTRYMVSGGGGAPTYEINPTKFSRKSEATRHFVSVTVSSGAIKTTAKRTDGSTIDLCGFDKGTTDWACDRDLAAVATAPSATPSPTSVPGPPPSRCSCRAAGSPGSSSLAWAGGLSFIAWARRRATRRGTVCARARG